MLTGDLLDLSRQAAVVGAWGLAEELIDMVEPILRLSAKIAEEARAEDLGRQRGSRG
jgi:hypothetical protein